MSGSNKKNFQVVCDSQQCVVTLCDLNTYILYSFLVDIVVLEPY